MKRITLVFALLFSSISYSFDIKGEWVIDIEKTMAFNDEHSKISPLKRALIKCMAENLLITYGEIKGSLSLKEHSCSFNDKKTQIEGFEQINKYQNIYADSNIVVLLNQVEDHSSLEVINKASENLIWVYYPGESPEHDEHFRYYYKRSSTGSK